jgi:hypothetical protein
MECRELHKESCKHLGRLGPTKHGQTQNSSLLPACTVLYLTCFHYSQSENRWVNTTPLSVLEGTTNSSKTGELIANHPPQKNKVVQKKWWEHFPSGWWGEEQNKGWKCPCGGRVTQQHCGENQALHCFEETRSKLKLTVSPEEKLISNSQACPVSGRCWWLLIYQSLMEPLLRMHLCQSPHPNKVARAQIPRAKSPQCSSIGKANIHCHATQYAHLKERECLAPIKKSHYLNLKSEERVQNTHWTDIIYIW